MRFISLLIIGILLWGRVDINFRDLSINDFIKMVAKINNKNLLITKPLDGKVNFISIKPLSNKELWQLLLDVLKQKGYTIVDNGRYLEVVPLKVAFEKAKAGKKTIFKSINIKLKYLSSKVCIKEIKPFLSNFGRAEVISSDKIMVIDFEENVRQIRNIIKSLDKKEQKYIEYIKTNTKPSLMIKKIKNMLTSLKLENVYKLYADDYNNFLIVVSQINRFNDIKEIIKKIDSKTALILTKVLRLKNTDAKEVLDILQKVINERFKKDKPSLSLNKEDNSIVVVGDAKKVELINSIIESLDIPKRQVYIKVKILELTNSKVANLGTKLGILGASASSSGLYTFSANLGGSALAFNPGDLGISIPDIKRGLALGAVLDLLETTGAAKKLSEPSILCLNNTPSTIYVGKTVSVLTQSVSGANTADLTKNSFARTDIGLKLTLKPRIDVDNKVAINVKGLIEDILPGSQLELPTTSKREIDTTAIVRNGQSIIIGGLIKDNKDVTINKVPLLGDIPVLGALFKNKKVNNDKTTITIILTPYIVNNTTELEKLQNLLIKLNEIKAKFVNKLIKKVKNEKK